MALLSGWGTQAWGVAADTGGGTNPPIVSNVVPAVGTTLQPGTSVSFDVTDSDSAIRKVAIWVGYPNISDREMVFDGVAFMPHFSGSLRTSIANGFHYILRRGGGWLDIGISINVLAIDVTGNED